MSTYSIQDIVKSTDRHKVFILMCDSYSLTEGISFMHAETIHTLNVGKELASYIDSLSDRSYLNIDVYDYTKKLLDRHKSKINGIGNDVLAIYNVGILMEPSLELKAVKLLQEFSKSAALIILWENLSELPNRLSWATQSNNVFLDFSEIQLKKLQHAI